MSSGSLLTQKLWRGARGPSLSLASLSGPTVSLGVPPPHWTLSQKASSPMLSTHLSEVLVYFTDLYIRLGGDLEALWCEKEEP